MKPKLILCLALVCLFRCVTVNAEEPFEKEMFTAVRDGDVDTASKLLVKNPKLINSRNPAGMSAIKTIPILLVLIVINLLLVWRGRTTREVYEPLLKIGLLRFILIFGFVFAAPLGILVFIISPPMPWYISALLVYVCGVALAAAMWLIMMKIYRYDRDAPKKIVATW
jgi:hypothetical protein